ncbi:MAG: hypothetical protein D6812_12890 [Deltaproteobacteria bacterium]|nr:MAG: hypothetical protein D6812_12890 [Deltaproteobacteria bacterium]
MEAEITPPLEDLHEGEGEEEVGREPEPRLVGRQDGEKDPSLPAIGTNPDFLPVDQMEDVPTIVVADHAPGQLIDRPGMGRGKGDEVIRGA